MINDKVSTGVIILTSLKSLVVSFSSYIFFSVIVRVLLPVEVP